MNFQKMVNIALLLSTFSFLSGCGDSVKSAKYFESHQSEMEETLKKCNAYNDPKKILSDENCLNAGEAFRSLYAKGKY